MYVISLIINGDLKKTALSHNGNEAVELARKWVKDLPNKKEMGYIAIDVQVKGKEENNRFAVIQFDDDPNKLKLNLENNAGYPIFSHSYSPVIKNFAFAFLEFALAKLTEYLNSQRK